MLPSLLTEPSSSSFHRLRFGIASPGNVETILPHPCIVLSDAWRPIADDLRSRMSFEPAQTDYIEDIREFAKDHLATLVEEFTHFADEMNQLFEDAERRAAAEKSDGDGFDIQEAVDRMEDCLDHLMEIYDDIRCTEPSRRDSKGWHLLKDAYRTTLLRIQNSLDLAVEFFGDGQTDSRKRDLPVDWPHELKLSVDLEATEEVRRLKRWARHRLAMTIVALFVLPKSAYDDVVFDGDSSEGFTWFMVALTILGIGLFVWLIWWLFTKPPLVVLVRALHNPYLDRLSTTRLVHPSLTSFRASGEACKFKVLPNRLRLWAKESTVCRE